MSVLGVLGSERARPPRLARWPRAYWLVVGTVCIGAFMGQLDASIVTVALPDIGHDLGGSVGAVEWVVLAYLLTLVGLVAPVGRFADSVGRKLLYVYGFGVFAAASALCGLAPNLPLLDACRVLQAVGAAMMQANSVALIRSAVPETKLGRALGMQGAAQALGLASGPTIGGLLLTFADWRWLFWVNVPAGALGLVSGWFLLPRTRDKRPPQRVDWGGLVLLLATTCAVMLALSVAEQPARLPLAGGLIAAAAVLLAGFLRWQRKATAPLLDLGLFARPRFSLGLASGTLSYTVLFGTLIVTPFFLVGGRQVSAEIAGLQLTALPVALGLVAPLAGLIADRTGVRTITVVGLLVAAAGLLVLAAPPSGAMLTVGGLAITGLGLGLFLPANNAAIMTAAPSTHAGAAAGIMNMARGLGTALGVGAAGLVYAIAAGTAGAGALAASRPGHGMTVTSIVLAAIAVAAAVIAALSREEAPRHARSPVATTRH